MTFSSFYFLLEIFKKLAVKELAHGYAQTVADDLYCNNSRIFAFSVQLVDVISFAIYPISKEDNGMKFALNFYSAVKLWDADTREQPDICGTGTSIAESVDAVCEEALNFLKSQAPASKIEEAFYRAAESACILAKLSHMDVQIQSGEGNCMRIRMVSDCMIINEFVPTPVRKLLSELITTAKDVCFCGKNGMLIIDFFY